MIGGLKDNSTVIIHGGGGGVNTAGIQLCRALTPNTEIIVTSHPAKIERVKELGANLVIDYTTTPDFSEAVKEFTNKKGADVILDHVGAKYLAPNMNSLGYGGRLVIIGVISGHQGGTEPGPDDGQAPADHRLCSALPSGEGQGGHCG